MNREQRLADKAHEHARKCKVSPPMDCPLCRANIAWFAQLPLDVLSNVLAERGTTKEK